MDPLSDVLSLLKLRSYMCGGFDVGGELSMQFPQHEGMKCYALVSGHCWLSVEGVPEAVHLKAGDCFLLPRGRPFRLASDLALTPVDARTIFAAARNGGLTSYNGGGDCFIVGGHFLLTGNHARILLGVLPSIVHIRKESDKAALRWSLERMMQELREPQPGGFLVAQHLAYMMLVQALRLHLAEGLRGGVGWLFALADKQMTAAISSIHDDPAHGWTFTGAGRACRHVAIDLRPEIQRDGWGLTHGIPDALENAAGRGQAGEFQRSRFRHRSFAWLRIRKRLQHSLQEGHGLFATAIPQWRKSAFPFPWQRGRHPREPSRTHRRLIGAGWPTVPKKRPL